MDPRPVMRSIKLRPPVLRAGTVPRRSLVERMLSSRTEPLVAVVAPAGYGKSMLLAEWAGTLPGGAAWVTADAADNDPSALLAIIALALGDRLALDPAVVAAVCARTMSVSRALGMLTAALDPAVATCLVLDNVDAIDNPASADLIAQLAWSLPVDSQVAYGSRTALPLPLALLRSRGAVMEIGRDELAMNRLEAELLLASAGATLAPDEIDTLLEQTEGWPAGLYLAALAAQRHPVSTSFAIRGDDSIIADYVGAEVLANLSDETVTFLTRTSVLDELSGSLCDAVLDSSGSRAVLESLEAASMMLVPLDRQRGWYRYHRLFRDVLAAELERRDAQLLPQLHRRAARWFEERGLTESAIRHAQRGGDPVQVVRLVGAALQPAYAAGRATDARGWLEWFRAEGLIDQFPLVAALGAIVEALSGHPAGAERWAAAAESDPDVDADDALRATLAFMRSLLCRRGVLQMRADAQLAHQLMHTDNGLRGGVLLCEALSFMLAGELDAAEPLLAHTGDVAAYLGALPVAAGASAFRAVIAIRRGQWDEARAHSDRAIAIVTSGHLEDYMEVTPAFAVAAQVAAHNGDRSAAAVYVAQAARLRPQLTYAVPVTALMQLEIARAYLQIGDAAGARTVLREARDILQQRPDLGVVAEEAENLRTVLVSAERRPAGASSLTTAELRLLPFLPTHLSFREIAKRLFVSQHTVKTQAISIYRKFGVSSRSEAIRCATEVGLLGS